MIYAAQILCLLGGAIIFFIFYLFNPINNNLPSSLMMSVLCIFFGLASLSIKENITKKGGKISFSRKIIGILIFLGMMGASSLYFVSTYLTTIRVIHSSNVEISYGMFDFISS